MKLSRLHPRHFWSSDRGLTTLLLFLVLMLIVLYTMTEFTLGVLVVDIFSTLVILAGVLTTFQQRWLRVGSFILGVATLASTWTLFFHAGKFYAALNDGCWLLFLGLLLVVVMNRVFQDGVVTGHRIRGAIVVYLLFGIIWALAYDMMAILIPYAFNLPPNVRVDEPVGLMRAMVYYSFITLTTLGYGDITPMHPAVRLLATFEAIVGQLYPAITLARLVSLAVMYQKEKS